MKKWGWVLCFLTLAVPVVHAQKITWSRIWGSPNSDAVTDIARDKAGCFYVVGSSDGGFDGQTNVGACVSKFNISGERLWTQIWGGGARAEGVVVDGQTNVYVCGQTDGSFHGQTNTLPGTMDMFLTKWTADGTLLWTRIWGSTNADESVGVVCDGSPLYDVYVGGTTWGSFGTAGQTNAKVGKADFCLTKFSTDGSFQWSRIWGGTNDDNCNDIAKDPSATYIYLTGITYNGVFDGQTNHFPYNRLALTAYDTSVVSRWSRVWGATNKHNTAYSVCANDRVHVAGSTFGSFDGQAHHSPGFEDIFITQFDAYGATNWTRIHGTNNIELAYGIAQTGTNLYLLGVAYANMDGQTRVGGTDFMLLKYDTSGNRIWTRLWGSTLDDSPVDLALDGTNGIFACGTVHANVGDQVNFGTGENALLTRWRLGPNIGPTVAIQRPVTNREFIQAESISCVGLGTDTDDGVLTNLQWQFGTNTPFSGGLTTTVVAAGVGAQTVTAYTVDTEFATGQATVVVTVLQDAGGLPDVWQTNFWPGGDSGGPTNDSDHDGADNRTEWESGTDPTNPLSVFKCDLPPLDPGTPFVIQWPSISNRDYAVSSSSNLTAGFDSLATVPATPPLNTYTTPASLNSQNFYRIEVSR